MQCHLSHVARSIIRAVQQSHDDCEIFQESARHGPEVGREHDHRLSQWQQKYGREAPAGHLRTWEVAAKSFWVSRSPKPGRFPPLTGGCRI